MSASRDRITRRELLWATAAGAGVAAATPASAQVDYPPESVVQQDPPFRLSALEPLNDFLLTRSERNLPGTRRWDFGLQGGIDQFGTTESVGDGVAARFVFTAESMANAGGPGVMWNQDTVLFNGAFHTHAGISFWVKGDGSSALGSFGWGPAHRNPFVFPLNDTEWHKVFARWEDFEPAIDGKRDWPGFSLRSPEEGRDHYYVVDRIRLFNDEVVEPIQPTPRRDLPGHVPAAAFIQNRPAIGRTLRLLSGDSSAGRRRRRSAGGATIVITGDSILDGSQLFYVFGGAVSREENIRRRKREYAFGSLAGDAVAAAYGFDNANIVHDSLENGRWVRYFGEDPGPGLNWITAAMAGRATDFAVQETDRLFSYEPDLVIYNLGVNDFRNNRHIDGFYKRHIVDFVQAARDRDIELALCTPIPTGHISGPGHDPLNYQRSPFPRSPRYAEAMREIAADRDCALVDLHEAYKARGVHAIGELQADQTHPNHEGHRLMATVVTELLTAGGLTIWDRGAG